MIEAAGSCCVCGASDSRGLVELALAGGTHVVLCGTHALMHRRSRARARSIDELRRFYGDRRLGADRRGEADELAAALTAAFNGDRREGDRRVG
ncbi:MAG TPA: hypothetical protein VKU41_12085 [Polyangiaceae bacterium]|nr:hypothetical protein [Polyangiaceae bacterium]